MKNVSQALLNAVNSDSVTVKPRIQIEFGNNRFNGAQIVTASSTKVTHIGIANWLPNNNINFWMPDDCFNNKNRNSMNWAVCDRGAICDGGYRAINVQDSITYLDPTVQLDPFYEHGWWSGNKSDASGNFASPEWIQSIFDAPRPINQIDVWVMEGYPGMSNITLQYQTSGGNWHNVVSNYSIDTLEYQFSFVLPSTISNCTGLRLYINSTWAANDYARISELQGLLIADVSDDVVSFQLNETREKFDTSSPQANIKSSTLDLTLENIEGWYSSENLLSPYYPYLLHDNKILVSIGIEISPGVFEYVQMGIFYSDQWSESTTNATAEVQCRDYSKYLQDESAGYPKYWVNTHVNTAITDLLNRAGKVNSEIMINNVEPAGPRIFGLIYIYNKSFWNFMAEIALADQAKFTFDESGRFRYDSMNVLNQAPYTTPVWTFDDDVNIIDGTFQTNLYLNSIIVNVNGVDIFDTGRRTVWAASGNASDAANTGGSSSSLGLGYNYLLAGVSPSDTTIYLSQNADNLGLPFSGWIAIDNEVIFFERGYGSNVLTNCTRGIAGTVPASHAPNTYVGQAIYFENIAFSTYPVFLINPLSRYYTASITSPTNLTLTGDGSLPINNPQYNDTSKFAPVPQLGTPGYPLVTAIDTLQSLGGHNTQARIMVWNYTAFTANLVIANTVPFFTPLDDSNVAGYYNQTAPISKWSTIISGAVPIEGANRIRLKRAPTANLNNLRLIRKHGKTQIVIDNPWIQTRDHANEIANYYFQEYDQPRAIIVINAMANPALQLGDRVTVDNFKLLRITNKDFNIININYKYDGSLQAEYTLREGLGSFYD